MGYTQSSRTMAHLMTEWRRQDPHGAQRLPRRRGGEAWPARRVAFLYIASPDERTAERKIYLAALHAAAPGLATAYALAQDFAPMLRDRQGHRLDDWIAQAMAAESTELRGFATGLLLDKGAVEAGLTLSWRTGPCAGHIHKVKRLARSPRMARVRGARYAEREGRWRVDVTIMRSAKRAKTVSAREVGDRLVVQAPAGMSEAELAAIVERLQRRLSRSG